MIYGLLGMVFRLFVDTLVMVNRNANFATPPILRLAFQDPRSQYPLIFKRATLTHEPALRAIRCPEAARGHGASVAIPHQSEQPYHRLLGHDSHRFRRHR